MSLINLNQINIIDSVAVATDGSVPIAIQFGDNIWSGNYAKGMLIPTGDTSERLVTITPGYFRYNEEILEFEGLTNGDWRPIGQLTQAGTNTEPSRSFIDDSTTGSYLISAGNYGIATTSVQRIKIDDTATTIKNNLAYENILSAGGIIGDVETTTTQIATLLANQTNTAIAAPLTYVGLDFEATIIDYLVKRDVGSAVGTLLIVNDGAIVSLTDTNTSVNSTGITFTATITTGTVEVKYTSTAGNEATMKYIVRRWGI